MSKLKEDGIIELLVQVKTFMSEFGIVKEEFLEWFEQDVPLVINVQNQLYIRLKMRVMKKLVPFNINKEDYSNAQCH